MTSTDCADGNQRNQRRHAHSDTGNLPCDESENDNRHRSGHTQQQLLETVEDVINRNAHAPKTGRKWVTTQSIPSVTQLSSGISVLWNGSRILKCSTFGAGVLVSQSAPPPSVGAVAGVPGRLRTVRHCPPLAWYPTDYFDQPLFTPHDLKRAAAFLSK